MTKVLWADFKSDLSDTRQHWHISFRYGWYISKCYRWYISFRYDWHNSFRWRWHIDSVAIIFWISFLRNARSKERITLFDFSSLCIA